MNKILFFETQCSVDKRMETIGKHHGQALYEIANLFNTSGIAWALGGSAMLAMRHICEKANDLDILISIADAEKANALLRSTSWARSVPMEPKRPYCTKSFNQYVLEIPMRSIDHSQMSAASPSTSCVDVMADFGIEHQSVEDATTMGKRSWLTWTQEDSVESVLTFPTAPPNHGSRSQLPAECETERASEEISFDERTGRFCVPLGSLEEWYVLYTLIGRGSRVSQIEEHWKRMSSQHNGGHSKLNRDRLDRIVSRAQLPSAISEVIRENLRNV